MERERFKELDDVLYGDDKFDATVLSVNTDEKGEPIQYTVELHEGYSDSLNKVVFADPNELARS